jgi:hypothetical protein
MNGKILMAAGILLHRQLCAATFEERFAADPASAGWKTFGNTSLFHWNPEAESLDVRWDSTQPNSYFYRPLGTVLGKDDDVALSFDLRLSELAVGITPDKPFTFELAVALLNFKDATSAGFMRGTGRQSPNIIELDYFPDSGFGATMSPAIVSSNNVFAASFTFPLALTLEDQFHIELRYEAAARTLTTTLQRNGEPFGPVKPLILPSNFTDYRIDTLAIASYSDSGADGSLLASGSIDNVIVTTPAPPKSEIGLAFKDDQWLVQVVSQTQWVYSLERSESLGAWRRVSAATPGTGGELELVDSTSGESAEAFYRVRLERP